MARKSLRKRLNSVLEGTGPQHKVGWVLDMFLVVLITATVVAVVLETVASLAQDYAIPFQYFEIFSVIIFSVEYIVRVWTCVERTDRNYGRPIVGRLRYIFSPMALIDLIAIAPFYLAFFIGLDLRFIRVFRLLRLLKLTRYSAALTLVGSVFYTERRPLGAAAIVMAVLLVFASSFVYLAERAAQPEAFGSIPAAMWWGMATLTTVGYGDVTPITPLGKVLGAFVTLLGVGMFAMPAGILASGFAQALRGRDFVITWSMVASVPIFSRLDAKRIAEIAELLRPQIAVPGEIIIHKDAPADCMYFISSGEVTVDLPGRPVIMHAGDFFGELALIDHGKRTATVIATTTCQLLLLEEVDLEKLVSVDADLDEAIHRIADERRSQADQVATPPEP